MRNPEHGLDERQKSVPKGPGDLCENLQPEADLLHVRLKDELIDGWINMYIPPAAKGSWNFVIRSTWISFVASSHAKLTISLQNGD
jgi:hypothetical protein